VEVEKNLDWDSDDDESVVDITGYCDTNYTYGFMIFGFHPYKEIVFLHSSRVVAYHFGRSKVQDLGVFFSIIEHFINQIAWVQSAAANLDNHSGK
jgi:hypothetical protein